MDLFEAYLADSTLVLPPLALDSVFVGDFEKSFVPNNHFVYILGANEGVMPSYNLDTGIITDKDISKLSNKNKLNTSGSVSNYYLTQPQTQHQNFQLNEIDLIKGNFLLKDERFVYIKNPMLSKQIKLNQTLKNFKSTSSIVDCLKSGGTKYYGKLKWEDGAELKAKFPLYNQTTDSTELEEPKETEQIAVEVTGIALFDNKPLRYTFGGEYKWLKSENASW